MDLVILNSNHNSNINNGGLQGHSSQHSCTTKLSNYTLQRKEPTILVKKIILSCVSISTVIGYLIALPLLAHLHRYYVLVKHILNVQQTFFHWPTKALKTCHSKCFYKGISISSHKGECIEEKRKLLLKEILLSIVMWPCQACCPVATWDLKGIHTGVLYQPIESFCD